MHRHQRSHAVDACGNTSRQKWDSYWDTFLAFRTLWVALAGLDVLDKDPRLVFVAPRTCSRSVLCVPSRTRAHRAHTNVSRILIWCMWVQVRLAQGSSHRQSIPCHSQTDCVRVCPLANCIAYLIVPVGQSENFQCWGPLSLRKKK